MNLQLFLTLLVVGASVGLAVTFFGKHPSAGLVVNVVVSAAGAFLGWFVFTAVSRTALLVLFAIGGSLALLAAVRALKK